MSRGTAAAKTLNGQHNSLTPYLETLSRDASKGPFAGRREVEQGTVVAVKMVQCLIGEVTSSRFWPPFVKEICVVSVQASSRFAVIHPQLARGNQGARLGGRT